MKSYTVYILLVGKGMEELKVQAESEKEAKRIAHDEYVLFRFRGYIDTPFRIVAAVEEGK